VENSEKNLEKIEKDQKVEYQEKDLKDEYLEKNQKDEFLDLFMQIKISLLQTLKLKLKKKEKFNVWKSN
jgi:tRNA A58 N-methylase Trm61